MIGQISIQAEPTDFVLDIAELDKSFPGPSASPSPAPILYPQSCCWSMTLLFAASGLSWISALAMPRRSWTFWSVTVG